MIITNSFHGTGHNFKKFRCPAYFTNDFYTAMFFAKRSSNKQCIYNCSLSFNNPLIVDLDGQSWGGFFLQNDLLQKKCIEYIAGNDFDEKEYLEEEGLTIGFLSDYAEYLGCDGVIAYNCLEENGKISTQYVAFNPNAIIIKNNEHLKI